VNEETSPNLSFQRRGTRMFLNLSFGRRGAAGGEVLPNVKAPLLNLNLDEANRLIPKFENWSFA